MKRDRHREHMEKCVEVVLKSSEPNWAAYYCARKIARCLKRSLCKKPKSAK